MIGVYKYENSDGEVVYIGKAKDIRARYCHHYYIGNISNWFGKEKFSFAYIETNSLTDADVFETLLINIYKPKHNKYKKYGDKSIFKIPDNIAWIYCDWNYRSRKTKECDKYCYRKLTNDKTPNSYMLATCLKRVVGIRYYRHNRNELVDFFIQCNICDRSMGINTLNRLLFKNNIPYEIVSKVDCKSRYGMRNKRFWVVTSVA